MYIVGLTGSIATGKSTAAKMLQYLGYWVYDSDAVVHRLLSSRCNSATSYVESTFPDVIVEGKINREALSNKAFSDPAILQQLETIIHPLVYQEEQSFLRRASARRQTLIVLDIPLLFETNSNQRCDAVIVTTAPPFLQCWRALSRVNMTVSKLRTIKLQQIPESKKRRQADFILPSGLGRNVTLRSLRHIIASVRKIPNSHWPPRSLPKYCNRDHHA